MSADYDDFDEPADSPIEQLMAELRRTHPDARPVPIFPRTQDDADCAEAERRAERRRGEHE